MSRALIAALFLLILGGSSAALAWYSGTDDEAPSTPTMVADALTVAEETELNPTPEAGQPASPTEPVSTPTPNQPLPSSTPRVDAEPTPTSVQQATPTPSSSADNENVDPIETPQWTVVEPARWAPTGVVIPDIGADAQVVGVGLTETGEMAAPDQYDQVGWFQLGAKPGEPGRAVLAGHVDSKTGPAVFYRLRELAPGAVIEVRLGPGDETLRYVVREIARYPEDNAPLERIFGPSEQSELILITCDGDFDFNQGAYRDRLVVYTDLLPEGS